MGKKRTDDKSSHQIRVNADLGEMIAWIVRVEDTTSAQLLDPMIRAQIRTRYEKHQAVIDRLKAAENALKKAEDEARQTIQEEAAKEQKPKGRRSE